MTTYTVRFETPDDGRPPFKHHFGLSDAQAAEVLEITVPNLLCAIQQHGICSTQDGLAVETGTDIEAAILKFQGATPSLVSPLPARTRLVEQLRSSATAIRDDIRGCFKSHSHYRDDLASLLDEAAAALSHPTAKT